MKKFINVFTFVSISLLFQIICFATPPESIIKGPYLQNVTQNSIIICWETPMPTSGIISYGDGNTIDYSVSDQISKIFHEVELTGLASNTEYIYQLEAGASIAGGTFKTAPTASTDFRFVAYGDIQLVGENNDNHAAVVSLIETMNPDILVNSGDLWQCNISDFVQVFFDAEKDLIKKMCLFSAKGNHEYWVDTSGYGELEPDRFSEYFSFPENLTSNEDDAYYSFNYGNSHFLFINTEIDYNATGIGNITDPQLTAIENDLQAANANPETMHIFVLMHKPAHSNGPYHGSDQSPLLSEVLSPIFTTHNVDIVFQGHDHNYQRFEPEGVSGPLGDPPNDSYGYDIITEGVTYVVNGGGGARFYPEPVPLPGTTETTATPNLTSLVAETTNEAMQIDVSGGIITATTLRTDGSILDKFTIAKGPGCANLYGMDLNRDRKVDFKDFAEFALRWLKVGCADCNDADPTCDNNVDSSDALILIRNWLNDYSLKGHWTLDSNAEDNSYYGYNGTINGMPEWDITGKIGSSIILNGINDYIEIDAYKGVIGTKSRTVAAWIKSSATSPGTIVSWGSSSAGAKWKFQAVDYDGTPGAIEVSVYNGHITGSTDLRDNQWHHVAAVLIDDGAPDVSEIQLYVDGVLETITNAEPIQINTIANVNTTIGTLYGTSGSLAQFFNGQIDDLRIYDRPLSPTEIQTLATMDK